MKSTSILAGIIAAIKLPVIMWNTFKNGGFETDEATVKHAKEFSKKLDSLRKNLAIICKQDPSFSLCADWLDGAYDEEKWGETPKLDKTMTDRKFTGKNKPDNTVKKK